MSEQEKLSPVDVFKADSNYLRGDIAEELVDENDFFGQGSIQLMKHHGIYQQDDRDARKEKKGKQYSFMVRTKLPGGKLTSDQLVAHIDLGDELGNGTVRMTSRQGIQLHGVVKGHLKPTIQRLNEAALSTLAACGDVGKET